MGKGNKVSYFTDWIQVALWMHIFPQKRKGDYSWGSRFPCKTGFLECCLWYLKTCFCLCTIPIICFQPLLPIHSVFAYTFLIFNSSGEGSFNWQSIHFYHINRDFWLMKYLLGVAVKQKNAAFCKFISI